MNNSVILISAFAAALVLTGCGSGDQTSRRDRDRLAEACQTNTNTNEATCDCVADTAREELSPNAFQMVLASIEGNDQRANELRGQLTIDEATEAGTFVFSSFARCTMVGSDARK